MDPLPPDRSHPWLSFRSYRWAIRCTTCLIEALRISIWDTLLNALSAEPQSMRIYGQVGRHKDSDAGVSLLMLIPKSINFLLDFINLVNISSSNTKHSSGSWNFDSLNVINPIIRNIFVRNIRTGIIIMITNAFRSAVPVLPLKP